MPVNDMVAIFDAPSIDHIVRSKTIPEIRSEVRFANFMLECNDEETELGWLEYRARYELALDIAEWYGYNLVMRPPKGEGVFYQRIMQILRKIADLDNTLQEHLKNHWNKKKGQSYEYDFTK